MREENVTENRVRGLRYADQNQLPKGNNVNHGNVKGNGNLSKPKSSWGSQIVKGLSGDKRTKSSHTTVVAKKQQASSNNSDTNSQKNPALVLQSRAKRSLITDLSCSINSAQVHPQVYNGNSALRAKSSPAGSHDLLLELDQLRSMLQESKEREFKLQAELSECKRNPKVLELERELEIKNSKVSELVRKVELLEGDKASLSEQLVNFEKPEDVLRRDGKEPGKGAMPQNLDMEVFELRRTNKELQLQKRSLACRVASMESQLASLTKDSEGDIVEKIKAEASLLRHTNEDLSKQVEGLQMSRLNEVEELAYLRWVNSCLRNELRNSCVPTVSDKESTPNPVGRNSEFLCLSPSPSNEFLEYSSSKRMNLIKKLKKWPIIDEDLPNLDCTDKLDKSWTDTEEERSPRRRHSISGIKCNVEDMVMSTRRQSDGFMFSKEIKRDSEPLASPRYDVGIIHRPQLFGTFQETCKIVTSLDVEKRALRIPNPPPRPSSVISSAPKEEGSTKIPLPPPPLPPPPPPPRFTAKSTSGVVQRAPQVVEFYHTLMKRDSRKESSNGGITEVPDVANARSSMIGEIENRSSHLLAIKADVETQGEFVNSLIREVNNAVYHDIEDVMAFVKWLDDELGFLVDERAVLKHFDWPEKKADTLREAAFSYKDLKKLEYEVCFYQDDLRVPCDLALKKMVALSEKMERTVYNLHRTRESLMRNCKEYQIPTDWMLDNGIISKIKFGSVKLAKKYMKRVAMELQSKTALDKDPALDYMLLQGVRFAFRIHQFAGGFDAETMHAFEELRNLAHLLNKK